MSAAALTTIRNGQTMGVEKIPVLAVAEFRESVCAAVRSGQRISALFGVPAQRWTSSSDGRLRLLAILADDQQGVLSVLAGGVDDQYPALTPDCPQAHWFEREIYEQWGVQPVGHPWLKPIRFHQSYNRSLNDTLLSPATDIGITDFFRLEGAEVHEVAVGPVHAGIIEPGHFRFQCHGENVYHLEISLGYQHRGIEQALLSGPLPRRAHYMETLAGDTTVGHATAYAQNIEALAQTMVPFRAEAVRGIALELERLANHTGDLGALAGDVGFLPTAAFCGRIRGDFLNLTALVCGNRFGRGTIVPGGVGFDLGPELLAEFLKRLDQAEKDVAGAIDLLWKTSSVMARFEHTGPLTEKTCRELGLVGPAARACGIHQDIRADFSSGIFRFAQLPVSAWHSGDVFARAFVRWLEIQKSIAFIREQAQNLPAGPIVSPVGVLTGNQLAVSLVEGWRGEICHVAITDSAGCLAHYKVVDPSFHNWMGLAMAMRGQQISDFPLCNKSFNLSYCGHDL
jgi:Ni,Fe-hydrogenase III large subunit/NADH:ubiquinone oxidoreductase subunit C